MKALLIVAGVVFAVSSARAEAPVPAGFKITPMNRATIFVRDQEASLKLYRDILGMRVWFNNFWDNDGINAIMNTKGLTLKAIALESEMMFRDPDGVLVNLVQPGVPKKK